MSCVQCILGVSCVNMEAILLIILGVLIVPKYVKLLLHWLYFSPRTPLLHWSDLSPMTPLLHWSDLSPRTEI